MKTALIMPREVLEELVFSLRTSFSRVKFNELSSPTAKRHLMQVERWIRQVESETSREAGDSSASQVPAFPITGAELHALQEAVDNTVRHREEQRQPLTAEQAEQLHLSSIARPPQSIRERIHAALHHAHLSSVILALVLGSTLALNVFGLVVLRFVSPTVLVSINVAALTVALVIWVFLHRQLLQHSHLVQLLLPLHTGK